MILIELGDEEFLKFKELIYSEAGIKLSDMKKALVQARLSMRVRTLGLNSYREYYEYLMSNYDSEKIDFINSITTNKTEFFRENKHFEYIKEIYLPELLSTKASNIRFWCAGCSTGEEPYSLAITLFQYFGKTKFPDIKILATDIDTNVLEFARNGIYGINQTEKIDPAILKNYFDKGKGEQDGFFKVKDFVKEKISFRRMNLLDQEYPMKKEFDIIFCRNVIIYFDKETQKELFKKYYKYLASWGRLFIGHSENIMNVTNLFSLVGNTIYRKNTSV